MSIDLPLRDFTTYQFPDYDGFLVYIASDRTIHTVGILVKLSRGYPKYTVPAWIEEVHMIRGNAPG